MKLNRPAVLASISLLTLGGLYYGFFRSDSEVAGPKQVRHEPKAPPVLIRPAENAGVTTPSFPEKHAPESVESESASAEVRAGASRSPGKLIAPPVTPEVQAIATDHKTNHPASAPTQQVADREDKPAQPPVGIRLAPDVRLPAAALPNDLNLNPITQKALQHIIDEFYQSVAAAVPDPGNSAGSGTPVVEENGEETRVIHNSPAVDAARMHADLRFKALFGHAAYNRMTMNALLESRLPTVTTEP